MSDSSARIFVVDDDWMNREVIEAHLAMEGYSVTTLSAGSKALEAALTQPPDLILLDAMLPDVSGFEVCRRLKESDATRFVPVVMVTALESEQDKLRAIEAGADDFITKPFSYLMLKTRVRSLLRLKHLRDELETRNALLNRILNRYVDEEIMQVILIDPDRYLKLGGETRRVSILFADISGFTAFAEQYTAQEVVSVLNNIFSALTEVVVQHHGTLDKYIGDELMAFFGAPVATGDDTLNAVMTAWEMQSRFTQVVAEMGSRLLPLSLNVGVHTGEVVVGNVGSERFMNYTVIGDAANTAHRLQEIAQDGQILLSETTYAEVRDMVEVRALPPTRLPGKSSVLPIFALTGVKA
ncbi:MAG: response regulator [Anaerolineae bacterium]|nr:response regulator [Anaerolineae bacterium]